MKPLWAQTLAWIAAILVAILFALAGSEAPHTADVTDLLPHGSETPR